MLTQDEPEKAAAEGRALRVLVDWRQVDCEAIQARRQGDKAAADAANKAEMLKRHELRQAADNLKKRRRTDGGGQP